MAQEERGSCSWENGALQVKKERAKEDRFQSTVIVLPALEFPTLRLHQRHGRSL